MDRDLLAPSRARSFVGRRVMMRSNLHEHRPPGRSGAQQKSTTRIPSAVRRPRIPMMVHDCVMLAARWRSKNGKKQAKNPRKIAIAGDARDHRREGGRLAKRAPWTNAEQAALPWTTQPRQALRPRAGATCPRRSPHRPRGQCTAATRSALRSSGRRWTLRCGSCGRSPRELPTCTLCWSRCCSSSPTSLRRLDASPRSCLCCWPSRSPCCARRSRTGVGTRSTGRSTGGAVACCARTGSQQW